MKCPLRSHTYKTLDGHGDKVDLDCLEEECAWWCEYLFTTSKDTGVKGECAILKIANDTGSIGAR